MKWAVVVPSCREEKLKEFMEAWSPLFEKHRAEVFVVRDQEPWPDIPDFIPKRTDMIRSWGFYQAWKHGADYTLSLDDDVLPIPGIDIFEEYAHAFDKRYSLNYYLDVGSLTSCGLPMRGLPHEGRGHLAIVQYGGWDGVPDLAGQTQIDFPVEDNHFERVVVPVPLNASTTCCAMNFAFRTEFTEIMWQFPLVNGLYNRWGDIWSGLVQKAVLDRSRIGVMLINGRASVQHNRASDPIANRDKEAPGMEINERLFDDYRFWERIRVPKRAPGNTYRNDFKTVTNTFSVKIWKRTNIKDHSLNLANDEFIRCRDEWTKLFD